jgi:hypothetical protein
MVDQTCRQNDKRNDNLLINILSRLKISGIKFPCVFCDNMARVSRVR